MNFKVLPLLTVILGIVLFYFQQHILVSLSNIYSKYLKPKNKDEILFTVSELKMFNGVNSDLLYLSILGKVYDVTAGKQHYGPGSNYNIFIGRDASKSFITGEFIDTNKQLDAVLELSHSELLDLENWSKLYDNQYIYKGKLIGRFYDSYGDKTEYMRNVELKLKNAIQIQLKKDEASLEYPPCNAEWDATLGSRVWCTKKSGGIDRDWEGVPRMLYSKGSSEPRCVCVKNIKDADSNALLKSYENCDSLSVSCVVKNSES